MIKWWERWGHADAGEAVVAAVNRLAKALEAMAQRCPRCGRPFLTQMMATTNPDDHYDRSIDRTICHCDEASA